MGWSHGCTPSASHPQLSWTVRELGAVAGVVVTASHNPSIYNGYKVYAADGGQVVAPEDAQLVAEVRALSTDQPVARTRRHSRAGRHMGRPLPRHVGLVPVVARFGGERVGFDHRVHRLARHRGARRACSLEGFGFRNVHEVPSQAIPDGAFPTVHSPNPEEGAALAEAVALAKQVGAAIVMGTDPDSDRVGIAVPDGDGIPFAEWQRDGGALGGPCAGQMASGRQT